LPFLGLDKMDVIGMLSTVSSDDFSWAAPLQYLAMSIFVFPFLYSRLFYEEIPGRRPWVKGLMWGLILWTLRGLVVMPVMGEGLFSLNTGHAAESIIFTLIGHIVYGGIFGFVAGDQRQYSIHHHRRRSQQYKVLANSRR
jgi:uncharacterized membrane protein YagU involved in acid resistance